MEKWKIAKWVEGWMDERQGYWISRWMNGRMDGQKNLGIVGLMGKWVV